MIPRTLRVLIISGLAVGCDAASPDAQDIDAPLADAQAARTLCIAIAADSTRVPIETFSLSGESTEGAEVVAVRLPNRGERIDATYFGETGRLSRRFVFVDSTLVCAEERSERYDRPLGGMVVDSMSFGVLYLSTGSEWLAAPTGADSAAGRVDSLPELSRRLRAEADSMRAWVGAERLLARKGAS